MARTFINPLTREQKLRRESAIGIGLVVVAAAAWLNYGRQPAPDAPAAASTPAAVSDGYRWTYQEGETRPDRPPAESQVRDSAPADRQAEPADCVATYARFQKLRQGYSRGHVRSIMGCEGELVSSQRIGSDDYSTRRWQGPNLGSGLVVTFIGNRVSSTFQMGLK